MKPFTPGALAMWLTAALFLPALATHVAAAQVADDSAAARQFIERQDSNPGPDIGKRLPENLAVSDQSGNSVRLREVLHGPAVVIKTVHGCPPCEALTDYASAHAATYEKKHRASIAVLVIGSETGPAEADAAKGIEWLHTPGMLMGTLLGGSNIPAVYFFDQDLTLVGVHTGLYDGSDAAMAAALTFPHAQARR